MPNNIAKLKWFNNAQVLLLCIALIGGTWGVSEYMNTRIVKSNDWVRVVKHVDESPAGVVKLNGEISDINTKIEACDSKVNACGVKSKEMEQVIKEINEKLVTLSVIESHLRKLKLISSNIVDEDDTRIAFKGG